jgi:general secretion pathway protein D
MNNNTAHRRAAAPAWLAVPAFALALAGCETPQRPMTSPIEYARTPATAGGLAGAPPARPSQMTQAVLPPPPPAQDMSASLAQERAAQPLSAAAQAAADEPVSIAIEQTPLPAFIQILYGRMLQRPYAMDQAVSSRTDLVTFKTSQPIPRSRLAVLAVELLRGYGLAVQDFGGLVRITADNAPNAGLPQLRRGKALPETPEPLRPVFLHVELDVVRTAEVSQWMRQILGTRVAIQEDATRNGFLLSGTQADLRTAVDLIQMLDQPRMRGRVARRLTPAFSSASELATRLIDVLAAQGYQAANSASNTQAPILVIPINAIGSVVVFTGSDAVMEHVVRWARELDRPPAAQAAGSLFTYAVKYADAQDLAKTIGDVLGGGGGAAPQAAAPAPAVPAGSPFSSGTPATRSSANSSNGRVVVNNATNTLIVRNTTADEYQQLTLLLRELDRPTRSALIEVVVAELTKNASRDLGVDWTYSRAGGLSATELATFGGSGFSLTTINNARSLLGRLSALASNNEARILSSPKILARNGESASIQVGDDVPIITSQQTAGTTGGLFQTQQNLIQTVQYRSTGMILRVRPVINSGNRLDLDVQQEVSVPAKTETGVSASPTIATRKIETKLSLRDGSTVLLGGLISRNSSSGNAGVPFFKDIPLLGNLFKRSSVSNQDTELLIMITPYVVNDDYEAEAITDAVRDSFGDWARDLGFSRKLPPPGSDAPMPSMAPGTPADPATAPAPAPASDVPVPPAPALPVPAPGTPGAGAPAAKPGDGVTMSRPGAAAPAAATPAGPAPGAPAAGTVPKPAPPAAAPTGTGGTKPPPISGGKPVEDPKVQEEIRKLFERRP